MAKTRTTAITSAEIESYLNSQDDFALEMQAYSLATSLGYVATHGGTYEDPVTKKPRQYDIRAYVENNERRVDLAIECKSLKPSYPLIVSRIPRIPAESYHQVICSLERERGPFTPISADPSETISIYNQDANPLYPAGALVGKSTTQLGVTEKGEFVSGDSEVYDKWSQALNSLAELAGDAAWYRDQSESGFYLTTLFPMLVIPNGTLWAADYDTSGKLLAPPHPIDKTTVFMGRAFWRPVGSSFNVSHLQVCTLAGAECFMRSIQHSDDAWERLFPMKEVLERLAEA